MEELIVRIGRLIKEKRQEKGYSTQELAELLDVSAGLVNNVENAKTDTFNIALMDKLSETLGIDLLSMLTNKTEHISDRLNISNNIPESLSADINRIIEAYINAAIKLNFNTKKLSTLQNKMEYEISFITDIIYFK